MSTAQAEAASAHPPGVDHAYGEGTGRPPRRSLSGWGGWPRSVAEVMRPEHVEDLVRSLPAGRHLPRGLGRSYGDAAQLSGGTVIDMTRLTGFDVDHLRGSVSALAGTSFAEMIASLVPRGWFLPVTPGTKHVTVGGALAADVHGKNHHGDGSMGRHVESAQLLTGDGRLVEVRPGTPEFAATIGAMGLTGTVIRATLRLTPVETAAMTVDTARVPDLDAVMETLVEMDRRHRYSVAWIDLNGNRRGRGVVVGGDHAPRGALPERAQSTPLRYGQRPVLPAPRLGGPGLVTEATIRAFNEIWFRRAPLRETGRIVSLNSFFYPLDGLGHWNRLYGDRGFLQYQFVVPDEAVATLHAIVERIAAAPTPVSLAVLKRFGSAGPGLLSFPIPGWTLALDMPLGDPELAEILDRCDLMLAAAGGRVYLAKDSRARAEAVRDMYPGLSAWRELRSRLDPGEVIHSDLAGRLELVR